MVSCSILDTSDSLGFPDIPDISDVMNSSDLRRIEGRKVSTSTEAHEGALYAMYAYTASEGQGTSLITGGSDGKVKIWDAEVGTK